MAGSLTDWSGFRSDPYLNNASFYNSGEANPAAGGTFETWTNGVATLHQADARALPLTDKSVHCCVTSPPYFGLRDYQLDDAGIGLEPTLGEWLENIVAVGREVWRVLRDDGTLWLNLGDAYSTGASGMQSETCRADGGRNRGSMKTQPMRELPPKNLMGQPWRAAFALQDKGWILRSAVVWHKPNPMPESVQDRPTNAYEMVFLLTKAGRYFYDAEAVRQPVTGNAHPRRKDGTRDTSNDSLGVPYNAWGDSGDNSGANLRNVWTIPTQGRPEAHFATFPDELPRRCILAGTSERGVCADCGAPWERVVEKQSEYDHTTTAKGKSKAGPYAGQTGDGEGTHDIRHGVHVNTQTLGWQPTCDCNAATVLATVLDPFVGSGTTLAVAQELGRRGVGTDLNPEYLEIARRRVMHVPLPMKLY